MKLLRPVVMFLIITVNFILQSTVLGYIEILSIKPNTAILLIVSYAILRGDIEGSLFGFFAGLIQDIFFGRVIGLYALLGALLGFICGKPFRNFFKDNNLMPLALSAIMTVAYEFLFYFTNFLFRGKLDFIYYFNRIILPETIYNTSLAIIIYRFMYSINEKIEAVEKNHRKLFKTSRSRRKKGVPAAEEE